MEDPRLLLVALAVFLYAVMSKRLGRWWISMPAAMVVLGVIVGPIGLGSIDIGAEAEVVKTTAEITLALMLFHDAVRIDLRAMRTGYAVPLRLLGIGLPLMIILGTGVAYLLLPSLGLVGAALVATMLAPTDAALGEAVVSDERLPVRIRQGLNVESGLNDGLSVPVFLVLLGLAAEPGTAEPGALIAELAQQIGIGVLCGVVVGGGGGALLRFASRTHLIEPVWRRIANTVLALSCFIAAAVLGGSGFIGAFVGGLAFGIVSEMRSPEDNGLTEYAGTLFDAVCFFLLGCALLPAVLPLVDWPMVLYALLSLVAIRLVTVVIAMARTGAKPPTVAFMGWFGPRGLATLVFAVLVLDEHIVNGEIIAAAAIVGILLSVFAHGFTAPPLVKLYADWWTGHPEEDVPAMERQPVHEHYVGRLLKGD